MACDAGKGQGRLLLCCCCGNSRQVMWNKPCFVLVFGAHIRPTCIKPPLVPPSPSFPPTTFTVHSPGHFLLSFVVVVRAGSVPFFSDSWSILNSFILNSSRKAFLNYSSSF